LARGHKLAIAILEASVRRTKHGLGIRNDERLAQNIVDMLDQDEPKRPQDTTRYVA